MKLPPREPATIVPALVGDPSPQSIVAVKSVTGADVLASVKLPTTMPFRRAPVCSFNATAVPGDSAASPMDAPPLAEAVEPPVSVIVTVTW